MWKQTLPRAIGVVAVTSALALSTATAAWANPTPDNGPEAGGSTVTVPQPAGISFTNLFGGIGHSVVLSSDGNTYAWGRNSDGQVGDSTNDDRSAPVTVTAPLGVTFTTIHGSDNHSLAIGDDGNTYAWGHNDYGQLGDGTYTNRNQPTLVQAPSGVTFISVHTTYDHSLAIGDDGNTYGWGRNDYGQLGDDTSTHSNVPVVVNTPAGVVFTSVYTHDGYSLAIGDDGNTYAWGRNNLGQLGDGTITNRDEPVLVQAPVGVTFTSIYPGFQHVLAISSGGGLSVPLCVGLRLSGFLGGRRRSWTVCSG